MHAPSIGLRVGDAVRTGIRCVRASPTRSDSRSPRGLGAAAVAAKYAAADDDPEDHHRRPAGFFAAAHGMPPWVPPPACPGDGDRGPVVGCVSRRQGAAGLSDPSAHLALLVDRSRAGRCVPEREAWMAPRRRHRGDVLHAASSYSSFLAVGLMVPLIVDQTQETDRQRPGLRRPDRRVPRTVRHRGLDGRARRRRSPTSTRRSRAWPASVGGTLLGFGTAVVGTVFQFLTIGLFTFYMTADAPESAVRCCACSRSTGSGC